MVRNRRVMELGWIGVGPCGWIVFTDASNETRQGLQGFQCVVCFCDTTFKLISPQLVGPGDRVIYGFLRDHGQRRHPHVA